MMMRRFPRRSWHARILGLEDEKRRWANFAPRASSHGPPDARQGPSHRLALCVCARTAIVVMAASLTAHANRSFVFV